MSKNEMQAADNFKLRINSSEAQELMDELEGLGAPTMDRVKIPSGGGLTFEIAGDDPDNPEICQTLTGIIIDHYPVNSYWEKEYDGVTEQPDCSSLNGQTGKTKDGQVLDCPTCPFNQYGTALKGEGKACKNMHRIFLLPSGAFVPMIITLPPTSRTNLKNYIQNLRLKRDCKRQHAITTLSLKKAKNSTGIEYSKVFFKFEGSIQDDLKPAIDSFAENIKQTNKSIPIADDEYSGNSSSNNSAYVNIPVDDDSDDVSA